MQANRSQQITEALHAARDKRREDFRALLEVIQPIADSGSLDELWIAAEGSYQRGAYAETIALFDRFDREAAALAPAWQQYLSAHRRSFASLQLGRPRATETAIGQMESALERDPELVIRYGNPIAMRAHLHELNGDFESARASFELAFGDALKRGDKHRALTAASDMARVYGIVGRPADAMPWLDRAEELGAQVQHPLAIATVRLRRAMLLSTLGLSKMALTILDDLVENPDPTVGPELRIDTLACRADVLRCMSKPNEAEHDLRESIRTATASGLVRHEAYARRDLAALYAERETPGDEGRAATEFTEAIRLALTLVPPKPLLLAQLAENVVSTPKLVARNKLPPRLREDLMSAMEATKRLASSSIYQRRERSRSMERAVARLSGLMATLVDEEIVLAAHVVLPRAGRVLSDSKPSGRIRPAEVGVLRLLCEGTPGGLTTKMMSARLGKSLDATTKSVMRLREAIDDDLVAKRVGAERWYSIRLGDRATRNVA